MNEENFARVAEIEREIAMLPEGSITKKKIKGKEYYYHRITRDGKRIENYIGFEDVSALKEKIDKRKALEKELKKLKSLLPKDDSSDLPPTIHLDGIIILINCGDKDFETETNLVDDGILASFDIVMLITRIEEEFDVVIPAKDIVPENFNSANALYALIQKIAEQDD